MVTNIVFPNILTGNLPIGKHISVAGLLLLHNRSWLSSESINKLGAPTPGENCTVIVLKRKHGN